MKKQLLILLVALMASMTSVWGQEITPDPAQLTQLPTYCVPATPVSATCVPASGPNNPIPGTLYNYTITVTNGGGTIHWLVTDNPNFITATGLTTLIQTVPTSPYLMATGVTYNDPANTSPTVAITWQSFPATTDVFLVTYVTNAAGCTDNIKVYKIEPSHLFTLDIGQIAFSGVLNTNLTPCVSPVFGAVYNTVTETVDMDYGINYLYYVVNAANWAHSWLPTFQLTSSILAASTTYAVDWAYPAESHGAGAVWHSTTAVGNIYTSADAVEPVTAGATGVGATGECIIVRVTVDHNQNQAIGNSTIDLAVDGIMYDQVGTNYTNLLLGDIHHTDGGAGNPCPWYDGYTNDHLTYTLTARPTIVDGSTPPAAFIPDNSQ